MAAITMRSPTFHATQRVIFTGKKTREKWKWFWTVPRQLDFVEFLQLMSCLVAHLSAFSVGFQWATGHKGRMLDDVQAPAAGAHFGVFFCTSEGFWSMNPWNKVFLRFLLKIFISLMPSPQSYSFLDCFTLAQWRSKPKSRAVLGVRLPWGFHRLERLNAELLARHLRFLRGFSCFGCFGKWMKISWLLTIHSKAYEYRVKANLFIILTFTFSYSFFGSFSMKVYLR